MKLLQSKPNTLGQYSELGIMQGDSFVVDEAAALGKFFVKNKKTHKTN